MGTYLGRRMRFAVTPDLLVGLSTIHPPNIGMILRCVEGLPEGCLLEEAYVDGDLGNQLIWVVVSHPSFEEVGDKEDLPGIWVRHEQFTTPTTWRV